MPQAPMIETEVPALDPDTWYEVCPDCGSEADCCLICFDEGLVPHPCAEER